MSKHVYNWRPSLPSIKNKLYSHFHLLGGVELPTSVDLRPQMPPVVDQGQIGSCTANALSGALGFLELQSMKPALVFQPFSRLFLYFNERQIEGDVNADNGATLTDGITALKTIGDCAETVWAYDSNLLFQKPSGDAYQDAAQHKIIDAFQLQTLIDMKHCLASGFPFVGGISVYESFEEATDGQISLPNPSEECLGGHALCFVAYDDSKQSFLLRNSWGNGWNLGGYAWIPYSYLNNPNLASDFWTIRK